MNKESTYADFVLRSLGFIVEAIPTSREERADWKVTADKDVLIVEEKLKLDDVEMPKARRATLDVDQVFSSHVPIRPDKALSRITRKAASQISATASHFSHDFRIVWFTAGGHSAEAKQMQYEATLYGSTKIFNFDQSPLMPCYFFHNSDFFRHKTILDGAVIAYLGGDEIFAKLYLNPLSPRYEVFKGSALCKAFGDAIVDPVKEEAEGHAYIVDSDLDRKKISEVIEFLRSKYKVDKITHMDMGYASAEIAVKPKPSDK